MATDVFDTPPYGFTRTRKKGWLKPAKGPQAKQVSVLKDKLAKLEERLATLENGKKKGGKKK